MKDLSCEGGVREGSCDAGLGPAYFVWERYEHKGMARPYVQVIGIKKEGRAALVIGARWHLQFQVLVWDVLLMKVHAVALP